VLRGYWTVIIVVILCVLSYNQNPIQQIYDVGRLRKQSNVHYLYSQFLSKLTTLWDNRGRYFCFCSSVPNFHMAEFTNELWTCKNILRDGSTLAISSTANTDAKKDSPEPPYSVSISMPIIYNKNEDKNILKI